jgi:hypothetical protein
MAEGQQERPTATDEAMLDPWFAAVRAEPAEPPLALLSAIVGDAAAVSLERRTAAAVLPPPTPPQAIGRPVADVVGGWKGLTALAACAATGFWIGIAGQVTVEDGRVWSGQGTVAAEASPDDPVGAFFDLAAAEG